ncbi:MAG: sulfatase-like hydrolase/transferase [Bacteroidaceae bacterium]|nr:sulfatase-like hydrolase/transferase [Bacteroidaceae bacterium]
MRHKYQCALTALLPLVANAQGQTQRPNIMLIVVDDMGYSDLGCFGGEVESPNLDALAASGMRFTQFYNSGRSCPSRAQLMTGRYAQTVGITGMGQSLTRDCVTIPEVLREAGYHTGMSGKWHLSLTKGIGNKEDQMKWLSHQSYFDNRPFAPIETYPCNRGFDQHWGTIWGVTDHFDPFSLVHNEEPIFSESIPKDFYYADFVADKAIDMMDEMTSDGKPFFMYVAFQEPHWPVQAKPQDIAKYKGKFDDGWDALRERRYQRMQELGLINPDEMPIAQNASGRKWEDETNKAFQSANMEVHAAMIDCVDQNIGRIIAELKRRGIFDNTLIIFTSDNGASSENYTIGDFDRHDRTRDGQMVVRNSPTPGGQLTYNYLHTGWAGAVNAPYRYWKTTQFHGGTAAPTIVHWPAGMAEEKEGTIMSQPCTFLDVMPTCLELAGAAYPSFYNGNSIKPMCDEARSFVPLLQDKESWDDERTLYWEHERGKAVRKGNWRLTALANGGWQLFDLAHDLSETNNVAAEHPEKVREMKSLWNTWAKSVGLNVPDDIPETKTELIFHYPFDDNLADASPSKYALTPSPGGISYGAGKLGRALHLNGNAQYLDLNQTGIFDTGVTQTTFCAWVYDENTAAPNASNQAEDGIYIRDEIILAQKDNAGTGRIYLYARAEAPVGGGSPSFFYNSFLSGSQHRATVGSLQPGTWQHVAIACDPVSQSLTYYINGERDCTVSTGAFEICTGGFRIGGHKTGKSYFKGYIDDAWFFKGLLTPEQIRQIRDNTFDPTPYYPGNHDDDPTASDWPLKDHAYTIRNFSGTPAYMVDNVESDNRITCEGSTSEAAYWVFEPTSNAQCYYVRNLQTGRYIQDYANVSGQMVAMGNRSVEYYVAASVSEGGRYGFACTSVTPHDFSSGTIGLNLRAESNQANCYVQTYAAAAGTNHRSFWTLALVPDDIASGINDLQTQHIVNGKSLNSKCIDLQGRSLNDIRHPGIYIQNGKKVAHRHTINNK